MSVVKDENVSIKTHLNSESPLTADAFDALINHKHEDINVDYKENFNPTDEKDWHSITSDAMAFANVSGGYIVFGVRDGDFCPVGLSESSAKALIDTNMVIQKMNRHVAPPFSMISTKAYTMPSGLVVVVMHIPESKGRTHIFVKEVSYKYPSGKEKLLSYAGMIYVRRSATNQVIQPEDFEFIIERRIKYYKELLHENIAKVVEAPMGHQVLVFDPNATSEAKNTFSISDRADAISVKGMSFTTAPQTDVEEICGWIALSQRHADFQPDEERLWYMYSKRHELILTNVQLIEILRFYLLRELPTFFWMRRLTAEEIGVCLLKILRGSKNKRIRKDIVNVAAFLGGGFNSKIRRGFDDEELYRDLRCIQNNPSDAFSFKALIDGDEENLEQRLTELASQLSQGSRDVLQKLRAKELDCRLYARTDKYILQPTETAKEPPIELRHSV
ncbi:MAG: ATP-binding protein [Sedimentisphaerales bacterium]